MDVVSTDKNITAQFFLTGGTALSFFYLHHRFSEDLDFFSEEEFPTPALIKDVTRVGQKVGASKIEQQTLKGQEIFYFHFNDGTVVKTDFAYFPFEPFGQFTKYKGLRISSLEDILLNKLQAIQSRKRARDYFDLYTGLKHFDWSPQEMKQNYRNKFDVDLPDEQLAVAFTNVLEATDLPRFLGKIDWKEVEDYFLKLAQNLKKNIVT